MELAGTSYAYLETGRRHVVVTARDTRDLAAETRVARAGSRFEARDSKGNILRGAARCVGFARTWTVAGSDPPSHFQVTKRLMRDIGCAYVSDASLLMKGGPGSSLSVLANDGAVILHLVPSAVTSDQRQFDLTFASDRLTLLNAVCLAQAGRLLQPGYWVDDPDYWASLSGTYT